MLKFGLLTNPTNKIVKEIRSIRKLGFDFVELGIEWPEGYPQVLLDKRKKVLHELKKFNALPLGHTAWWMDFTSPYEFTRRGWVEEAKKKIVASKSLGIKFLNFHTSSRYGKGFYSHWASQIQNNYIRSMRELIPFAERKGVTIMLENAAEVGEIKDFKDYKYVLDNLPKAKVHLDLAHAYINGGLKAVQKFITYFNERIVHLHIHDNHGEHDEHLPLGKGKINFVKVVKWLKEINYDKTITFEVFTSHKDAIRSREIFKKLWNKI